MSTPTAFERIRTMKKDLDAEIKKVGMNGLQAEFVRFFEGNPDILGIRWTQYTPYFCDGDPCIFGVNWENPALLLKSEQDARKAEAITAGETIVLDEDEEDADGYEYSYSASSKDPKVAKVRAKAFKAAEKFLKGIVDDDIFMAVFGDHVQVTATRKGFAIEEYEHD